MYSSESKTQFDRDGFVMLPGFLHVDEITELRAEVARYIADVAPSLPPKDVCYEDNARPETLKQMQLMFQHDAWFKRFFFEDRFVQLAEHLLGGKAVGKNLLYFDKPPRVNLATPPHQDASYFMITPNEAVTMWLALDEVNEENGCVRYVAGSPQRGLRGHTRTCTLGFSLGIPDYNDEDHAREQPMIAHPGDLVAHHALTIHRADENASERPRRGLGLMYYAARAQEDIVRKQAYQAALAH